VAIYDNAGNLVAETAELNGSSFPASNQWLSGAVTQYSTIVGGDAYTLALQKKPGSSYTNFHYLTVSSGVAGYAARTYGAFPSTNPSMGNFTQLFILRVGVEAVASGFVPYPFSRGAHGGLLTNSGGLA
jgi:hypothetical protein